MKQNWIAIVGKIDFSDGIVRHTPPVLPEATPADQAPVTVARSNIEFESGEIHFETLLTSPDCRCQVGLVGSRGIQLFAGLNVLGSAYGFALLKNNQWEPATSAGFGDRPPINQWIEVVLKVAGSALELFVGGVSVCSYTESLQKGPVSLLFQGASEVLVRNLRTQSAQPVCFVVMQFTDEYNALYADVIKPTCEHFGYAVVRGDDSYNAGPIIEDITRSIRESAIVIADITPNNANVFYEVGYAHGIGKTTILLSDRKRERLPFDVSGFRTLFYDNTIGGKSAVEEKLRKHLASVGA